MVLDQKHVIFLLMMVVCGGVGCRGALYKVGDDAGWTIIGDIDYDKWASIKNFRVGDILVFEYDNQFHNVKQVTLSDYRSCNQDNAVATFSSGNDSITIKTPGHYYYICGFPGHCQAGQRVNIRVLRTSPIPTSRPSPSPLEPNTWVTPSSNNPVSSGPSQNCTTSLLYSLMGLFFCCLI